MRTESAEGLASAASLPNAASSAGAVPVRTASMSRSRRRSIVVGLIGAALPLEGRHDLPVQLHRLLRPVRGRSGPAPGSCG